MGVLRVHAEEDVNGFVTAVFMMLTANRLDSPVADIGLFAVGVVALITVMIGFLIAAGNLYDESLARM